MPPQLTPLLPCQSSPDMDAEIESLIVQAEEAEARAIAAEHESSKLTTMEKLMTFLVAN